jgi:large subunit ribosomal protein L15
MPRAKAKPTRKPRAKAKSRAPNPEAQFQRLALHDLKAPRGSHRARIRKGRGPGSGIGKTAGRGGKGQTARQGGKVRPGFEGGQMPLIRRLPKRGFNNKSFKSVFGIVNLDDLEKKFAEGASVTETALRESGVIRGRIAGVKVLGRGELSKKLSLEVDYITASAREKIEKAGGSISIREKRPVASARKPAVKAA